jgi:hypothetical protein
MNEQANGAPNKTLNWPTVILILVSGGTNWFATHQNSGSIDYGREQVIRQVNDLHSVLDDFEKRQGQALENQKAIIDRLDKLKGTPQ